jgi:hypothetical protein
MVKMFIDNEKEEGWVLLGVSRSVSQEGGFGPSSFYLNFHSVLVKIYLGKPYTIRKLLFCSFIGFLHFSLAFLFCQKKCFEKKMNPVSLKGG